MILSLYDNTRHDVIHSEAFIQSHLQKPVIKRSLVHHLGDEAKSVILFSLIAGVSNETIQSDNFLFSCSEV